MAYAPWYPLAVTKAAIQCARYGHVNVCLEGPPGVAKSTSTAGLAEFLGAVSRTLRPGGMDAEDLAGYRKAVTRQDGRETTLVCHPSYARALADAEALGTPTLLRV